MSCNSCSNITLPAGPTGPAGPVGPAGNDGTDGIDGVNGADGADGADGSDGVAILKIIGDESSDYTSSSPGRPTIPVGDSFPWTVPSGNLSPDYSALSFEGLIFFSKGDAFKTAQIKINSTNINVSLALSPIASVGNNGACQFKVTFIRTSSTELRVESVISYFERPGSFYSTNEMYWTSGESKQEYYRNGQVVTVSDMGSNSFDVDLEFTTANSSQPLKLVNCKLLKLKKV